jgi:hypothetical protein
MGKKEFKNTPAMDFFSQETIEKVDGAPAEPQEETKRKGKVMDPPGYLTLDRQPKKKKPRPETKSRRVQALVQPSIWEKLQEYAEYEGISTNEALNQAIREFVEKK